MPKWFSPFDSQRRIGSTIEVQATQIKINLTLAGQGKNLFVYGQALRVGELNEYVFIDIGTTAILGKLTKVWLEGAERLSVEQLTEKPYENHPVGYVQPLVTINANTGEVERGISQYPRLGAQVYAAHADLVAQVLTNKQQADDVIDLAIGHIPNNESTLVHASPEQLFSRHCAILGSTGSGKSNTVAKLLELIGQHPKAKVILIDATGEYTNLENCQTYYVGNNDKATISNKLTFPYWELSDTDLFALLRPSPQVQYPKLVDAIQSLKAASCYNEEYPEKPITGFLKSQQNKSIYYGWVAKIAESTRWNFKFLAEQIGYECVWPTGGNSSNPNLSIFGGESLNDLGHCQTLIGRVKVISRNQYLKWLIIDPNDTSSETVKQKLQQFITGPQGGIFRLDVSAVPFEANAREILVNGIGRCLLDFCRGESRIINSLTNPLLAFIDEAHQFLNKSVGEENSRFNLDAFGNIAKEGRKYGLNVVIATQRPRDIPEDVLSQIGAFLVHRLTNPYDQDLVKKSIGDLDYFTANSLPTLATGEALLLGVDFNFAMRVKIKQTTQKPESDSVKFSTLWSET